MFENLDTLKKEMLKQAKTKDAKNLLKDVFKRCKKENKTPKETFSEVNLLIINPLSMGTC
jgi:hypothetical protein